MAATVRSTATKVVSWAITAYAVGVVVASTAYNVSYIREHGFGKWTMGGMLAPSAEAIVWPYVEYKGRSAVHLRAQEQRYWDELDHVGGDPAWSSKDGVHHTGQQYLTHFERSLAAIKRIVVPIPYVKMHALQVEAIRASVDAAAARAAYEANPTEENLHKASTSDVDAQAKMRVAMDAYKAERLAFNRG